MKHFNILKRIGLALLFVPVAFLLFFGIGEIARGVPGGVIHLIQLLPLIILLILAFFNSDWAGYLLVIIGSILGLLYLFNTNFSILTILIIETMLFGMPVVAGIFLILSKKDTK